MKAIRLSLLSIILFTLSACSISKFAPTEEAQSLKIVTTIAPLYSLTANIIDGVANVELNNLLAPGFSEHTVSLTPKAAKNLNQADIIIINGLSLEVFLEKILNELPGKIIDTSKNVPLLKVSNLESSSDNLGQFDAHIWLSPRNAKIQAENIATALINADPLNASLYSKNLQSLKSQLDNLNAEVLDSLKQLDIQPYIVFHDAYQYFEQNFNIKSTAFLEEFPGKEPSAQYLASLIDIIKKNKVQAIFVEPQFSPKLAQTLAQDYGLKIGQFDPLGQDISKDAYFKLIRSNLKSFQDIYQKK